jgi:import inner membrane translocase subunit TIM54
MGLPNMKMKLPSRNWMIFIGITGTFSGLVMYDKRETRRAQRKWAKLVEHLAKEPLDPKAMPRKLTVFIESPPIDGLRIAQDHFKDYVKPVLVASGLDWEFIQGRKEGDVRAELAEKIRKERLLAAHEIEEDDVVLIARSTNGTKPYEGPQGEIVIGRNTWKEYVRGLHEGWLGPVHEPKWPEPEPVAEEKKEEIETLPGITVHSSTEEAPVPPPNPDLKEDGKPAKPKQPRPWISTADYANAELPATLPDEFSPSAPIPFPHILGFFNTHIRFYRFLTRRHLADNIGREVAAVILAHSRPYHTTSTIPGESFAPSADSADGVVNDEADKAEQDLALKQEEKEWHKTTFKPLEDLTKERTWLDDMVLDPRIAGRMRRAELTPEEEVRAAEIGANIPEEDLEGWFRSYCRQGIRYVNKEFLGPKQKRPGDVPLDSEDL